MGNIEQAVSLGVTAGQDAAEIGGRLSKAVAQVDQGEGVLILTDMFGGSPNNISLTLLDEGKVEVVTGVNLPMIIKAVNTRKDRGLAELAKAVCETGRNAISVAGELLAS